MSFDSTWGTDATTTWTRQDRYVWVFPAVGHPTASSSACMPPSTALARSPRAHPTSRPRLRRPRHTRGLTPTIRPRFAVHEPRLPAGDALPRHQVVAQLRVPGPEVPPGAREPQKASRLLSRPLSQHMPWGPRTTKGLEIALEAPVSKYARQRPTLPQGFPCSTIGARELNFRVRNGNGCGPSAIIARQLVFGGRLAATT